MKIGSVCSQFNYSSEDDLRDAWIWQRFRFKAINNARLNKILNKFPNHEAENKIFLPQHVYKGSSLASFST